MAENNDDKIIEELANEEYKYGFTTDIDTDYIPAGLNEDTIRLISEKKGEPDWLLEFRLKAYNQWKKMEMPHWPHLDLPELDYQAIK
ncbi:MAG: Fe-S cluster assembly protein SufB, partial [Paludibacteraceae bacterium]|nr:Fe-S cluster assembly protein SufB [Paludibacteraceae bacterium]